jgi:hypothetical protein
MPALGPLPLPSNIAEPADVLAGVHSQPISQEPDPFDPLGQYRQMSLGMPQQSFFTASSAESYQATELGSFTHPSFQATGSTHLSQTETQTEMSSSLHDNDIDADTPKYPHAEDFANGPSNDDDDRFVFDSGFNATSRYIGGQF